ncbi:MAG: hypothetical protein JXA94_03110 [Parachlamydiales bacterium]|nr:hypothetical protein [Parachlamydiales bacterium]
MQIKINQKFYFFTQEIKNTFLILNTHYSVKIYPGLLLFSDLISKKKSFRVFLNFKGPVKDFKIFQDLKEGFLKISFHIENGFVSYKILPKDKNLQIYFEKAPQEGLDYQFDIKDKVFSKDSRALPIEMLSFVKPQEFLSFGVFKKQDLTLINRRLSLLEIFPIIFFMSQFYIDVDKINTPADELLLKIKSNILNQEKDKLDFHFLTLIKALFFDAFVPRVQDEYFQNIIPYYENLNDLNPIYILKETSRLIRSLFIQEDVQEILILPCLLPIFHAGRFLNIETSFALIDIEWSKKLIRKVIIKAKETKKIKLSFQSKIKSFRLKNFENSKLFKTFKNHDLITFEKEKVYFLDRFQK